MDLVQLLVFVAVCGIVWALLGPYIAEPFRKILIVIFVLIFALWLLAAFGIYGGPYLPLRR